MNKYFVTPIKQRFLAFWVAQDRLEEWIAKWKFFFILTLGRSGTSFMANFLNSAHDAYVFHEPVVEDFNAYVKAFYSPRSAEKYIQGFRKREIYLRMNHITSGTYGEVNSVLRRHAEAIKKSFPNVTLIHLVRDGRDVVRSLMPRRIMTIKDPVLIRIHPKDSDSWKEQWKNMDRFSRLCWLWQAENSYLRTTVGKTVHFEKILSSYEYFSNTILDPCGIDIAKSDWEIAINSPRNVTTKFSMPKWQEWTKEQKSKFKEICGDEMHECGYDF